MKTIPHSVWDRWPMATPVTVILILAVAGCSATRSAQGPDEWISYETIRKATIDGTARIHLTDGSRYEATRVFASRDSLHWRTPATLAARSAALGDVCSVTVTHHGRGAGQGLGLGLICGGLAGAMIGFADGDDTGGIIAFSAEEKAAMGGVALGLVGGLLGAVVGATAGASDVYEFAGTGDEPGESAVSKAEFLAADDGP